MSNALDINDVIEGEMVQEFQCQGCVSGPFEECYQREQEDTSFRCKKHCLGTTVMTGAGMNRVALGLPTGFNKEGFEYIRLYKEMPPSFWNHLNVPVWVLEQDGYLFVKTYSPRINKVFIDVIKDGKISDMTFDKPATCGESRLKDFKPINVGEFIEEID